MNKIIQKIEPKKVTIQRKLKVAAYARVSMDTDRLRHSLSAQISYYNNLIQKNPLWEFVEVYADLGISGTSTKKRDEFNRMIKDAENGKIDIILTKSIQRFARNTLDLLETVRHLKDLGVEVRFEKENINSLSGDGELMLSILASFAQEESRSISNNVKWRIIKNFEKGIPNGKFDIYGYRWENEKLVIVPEEAEVVKLIYANYLKGISAEKTANQLDEMGVLTKKGGKFPASTIRAILRNIHYTGNLLLQKEYSADPISKKKKINKGELPQYFVENTHEAIISMDVFRQVEAEIMRRREEGVFANPAINTTVFTSKIKCPYCQKNFNRSTRKKIHGGEKFWLCANRRSHKSSCGTGDLNENILKEQVCEVLEIDEFDEEIFKEKVSHIDVIKKEKLIFHLKDGSIKEIPFRQKYRILTEEMKKVMSDKLRHKHRYTRKKAATPFTGMIECAKCGASFSSQKSRYKTNTGTVYLSCSSKRSECPKNSIKLETLKKIVIDALNLDKFYEEVMDDKIERIFIADNIVTIAFKDRSMKKIPYKEKQPFVPWSNERREDYERKQKEKKNAKESNNDTCDNK